MSDRKITAVYEWLEKRAEPDKVGGSHKRDLNASSEWEQITGVGQRYGIASRRASLRMSRGGCVLWREEGRRRGGVKAMGKAEAVPRVRNTTGV